MELTASTAIVPQRPWGASAGGDSLLGRQPARDISHKLRNTGCFLSGRRLPSQLQSVTVFGSTIFSERELTFTFAICYRPSVCRLSVCRLSVTFVRPTQAVEIFGNISTALGTLAIH